MKYTQFSSRKSIILFTLLLIFGLPLTSTGAAFSGDKKSVKSTVRKLHKKKTVRKSKKRNPIKTYRKRHPGIPEPKTEEEFEGDAEKRKEWFISQRMYPFSKVPAEARRKAWEKRPDQSPAPADSFSATTPQWRAIGPAPTSSYFPKNWGLTSGRVNAIA